MLVSFLLPTRRRFDQLKRTISSFATLAQDCGRFEFILKVDEDDDVTRTRLHELNDFNVVIRTIISPRLNGYKDLHRFYNMCATIAAGDWLWLCNDDEFAVTRYWDCILANYDCDPLTESVVVFPYVDAPEFANNKEWYDRYQAEGHHLDFPMVSRAFYEANGRFSSSPANDTYLIDVSHLLANRRTLDLFVGHSYTRDETHPFDNEASQWVVDYHNSPDNQRQMKMDVEKIHFVRCEQRPEQFKA